MSSNSADQNVDEIITRKKNDTKRFSRLTSQNVNMSLSISLNLFLLDVFIGIPFAALITYLNKRFITYLGYEKIMRCPSGIFVTRILFATINVILIVHWALQLAAEKKDRVLRMEKELQQWDGVVGWLEEEHDRVMKIVDAEAENQLKEEENEMFSTPAAFAEKKNKKNNRPIGNLQRLDSLEVAVDGTIDLPVPTKPSHPHAPSESAGPSYVPTSPYSTVSRKRGKEIAKEVRDGPRSSSLSSDGEVLKMKATKAVSKIPTPTKKMVVKKPDGVIDPESLLPTKFRVGDGGEKKKFLRGMGMKKYHEDSGDEYVDEEEEEAERKPRKGSVIAKKT